MQIQSHSILSELIKAKQLCSVQSANRIFETLKPRRQFRSLRTRETRNFGIQNVSSSSGYLQMFSESQRHYSSEISRYPVPFSPRKVLVVSKVTLLNYEARKAFRKPWRRLTVEEQTQLSKELHSQGFNVQELVGSHGISC